MMRSLQIHSAIGASIAAMVLFAIGIFVGAKPCVAEPAEALERQRHLYRTARSAWDAGERATFARLAEQLREYPLHPYLEFEHLRNLSYAAAPQRIDDFLGRYGDMPLANRLRDRLLEDFYTRRNWSAFLQYYRAPLAGTGQQCRYQEARFHAGERRAALAAGLTLWNVARSQPDACDPLFALLEREGAISEEIAWQRFTKAVRAGELRLARYLRPKLDSPSRRNLADRYLALYRDPKLLGDYDLFPESDPEATTLIGLALQRAARSDAAATLRHWRHYAQQRDFGAAAGSQIVGAIARGLHEQRDQALLAELVASDAALLDDSFHEWLLRQRLAGADWSGAYTGIAALPVTLQKEPEWQYWRARTAELAGGDRQRSEPLFAELAQQRSYYGFLASDWLRREYRMLQRTTPPDRVDIQALAARPAFLRVRELLHHGQELDAAREWWRATRELSETEWDLAGQLAHRWGWHYQAILAMVKASRWDDLDTRFPVVHQDSFSAQAARNALPLPLALAVARQESAFRADAVSPAGARGLMQLMPATANEVARRHGIAYRSVHQLFDPSLNIRLGTRYYRDMLDRFQGNRILATAAYNAGPGRVRQWLDRSAGRLPFDAWIEAIPFTETRNYVQNVLAFSAIYAHRLGSGDPMLSRNERDQLL